MATIEGTGIKTPSEGSQRIAKVYYGGPEAEKRRQLKKDLDKFMKDFGGSPASDPFNPKGRGMGDRFDPTAKAPAENTNFFSPGGGAYDSRNNIETASAGSDFSGLVAKTNTDDGYNQFIQKDFGVGTDSSTYRSFPNYIKQDLKDQYNDSIKFKEGTQINQAPTKEKTIGERVADFTGNVVNTLTGTQSAVAQTKETGKGLFGGSVPEGTYSQFSPTTKSQYQTNREENRPFSSKNLDSSKTPFGSVNLRASEKPTTVKTESKVGGTVVTPADTSALNVKSFANKGSVDTGDTSFSSYVRGGGEGQQRGETSTTTSESSGAPRQTVASLPSDYKQTEAKQFAKTKAYQEAKKIAKRNPNVSVGVDSKGQPTATATNDSGVARAQAAAVNRKLSGKSISQVKAANRQAMRDSAAERHSTFKKTGKSTVSARRAAAKKANQAAAKKRHASFKKKRAAAKAAKAKAKARKKAFSKGGARNKRRRGRRGRRCDIFLKYNISPLTNMNLIRDDLAEVAYFVKEIQE